MSKQNKSIMFGIVAIFLVVAVAAAFYYFKDDNSSQSTTTQGANSEASTQEEPSGRDAATPDQAAVPGGYTKYENTELGFLFVYPSAWSANSVTSAAQAEGVVADFVSPEQHQEYSQFQGSSTATEGPLNSDLMVYHWDDVNSESLLGGTWEGMQSSYANLEELLSDEGGMNQLVGTTQINGVKAYKVEAGGLGQTYAIMFETSDGIYKFEFVNIADEQSMTAEANAIVSSIRFAN